MAITNGILRNPIVATHAMGHSPPTLTGVVGAAVPVGALVKVSSGLLIPVTATADLIVGVAQSAATATGQEISYIPWWPGVIFDIYADGATAASVTITNATYCFGKYGVGVDAGNGYFYANLAEATEKSYVVVYLPEGDATAAAMKRIYISPTFTAASTHHAWSTL